MSWGVPEKEEVKKKDDKKDESGKVEPDKKVDVTLKSIGNLKDLDLKIKKGEFVCIIGDVGSGKSSILSSLIGDLLLVDEKINDKFQ
jgi:ABC-type bacteriocin/lantibiotic exporter with double-glycine peptidase domain